MSGNGRRGRRGGRRQRRREELAKQETAPTNGQAGPGHPVPPPPAPAVPAQPRPISARELVARLEAMRAQEEAAASSAPDELVVVVEPTEASAIAQPVPLPPPPAPRRFAARGGEWIAHVAGRGTGGTGRVAPARIGAIRFAAADTPELVAVEVISPRTDLDQLYDEELAELLERGLRLKGTD